ncbi:ATP-binding cassette domain-containing protein [Modestobacter sp. I12A-02628]|uniref:ABC transporter ATP-binding protein n=1 Tax=Goekera deserti TaxID=2497753 RepID=A0A7K3WF48_9ACTN|nr:ATP-binding cassette domain-containing protein [Goekera deserti]MPQ97165.1 ATP-binding cassette domain-containing protein [Goekera deserti]NDI46517.1 ATP-binding cassette domain-containing protein [Goekera deserti]NEL54549.1 ABC transporter ATP-binding protein [Goekera deserti]
MIPDIVGAGGRPALAVRGLSISVHGRDLVHDVDLTVAPGQRLALIGASGSGKSLTAGAVLGHLPPGARVRGTVQVGGHDVTGVHPARRPAAARAAAVAQDSLTALNPLVPVGAQLATPLRRRAGLRGPAVARRSVELLIAVGIEDPARVLRSCAGELSGGQRQRVCIAIALASEAGLLVADEPTTALDLVTQAQVVDVVRRATQEAGLLFITHDVAVAVALCDTAVVLAHGRVVERCSTADLAPDPQHAYTRDLVAATRLDSVALRPGAPAVAG